MALMHAREVGCLAEVAPFSGHYPGAGLTLFAVGGEFPIVATLLLAGLLAALLLTMAWLKRSSGNLGGWRDACRAALKVAAIYLTFSGIWILCSDYVVKTLFQNPEHLTTVQTYKGLTFVVVSALLVGWLVCRDSRKIFLADASLRESEQRFRNLVENAQDVIFSIAPDGTICSLNEAFVTVTGWPREQWLGRRFHGLLHPEDLQPGLDLFQRTIGGERVGLFTFRILKASGEYAEVEFMASTETHDGQVISVLGIARDVTERKRAEAKLHLQDTALCASANAVVITDRAGTIQWVNPAFSRLTGYSADEAIGRTPRVIRSGRHEQAFYEKMWAAIAIGNVWRGEVVNRRKDGSFYTEDMTITPVRGQKGDITHFIAIKQDVTEQKELEEKFLQSQKMQAVGQLAAGVAHDFNNILTVITGYVQLLGMGQGRDADTRGFLEQVKLAADRAAKLTRQLLAFSRKQDLRFESLDFNMLIKDMTAMLRRIISEDIQLETRLAKELPPVHADAGMMGQVLLNLAVNARDAMPNGGKLVVTTEVVEVSSADSLRHPEAHAGDFVCLSVQDNGCGMSPEVLARIFEPFFTTKATTKGTGLGLATVHGVVKQHDGWLEVVSQPGRGSNFSVFLPLTPETITAEQETRAAAELHGGSETILLVEDESSVRSLAALLLRRFGYHVLEAESGEKCLELLASTPEKIDLLVTDVVMPGKINGRDLAERAAALKPGLKAIFISGYDSDAASQEPGSRQGIDFLQKPFDPNELVRLVRSRLDAGK